MNILLPCGHESNSISSECLLCSKYVSDPQFKTMCEKIHKDRQIKNLAPIMERIESLTESRDKFQSSGLGLLEETLFNSRMEVCKNCTSNVDGICTEPLKDTGKACGCIVSVKAKIPTEQCPAGKWPKLNLDVISNKIGGGCGGCNKRRQQ